MTNQNIIWSITWCNQQKVNGTPKQITFIEDSEERSINHYNMTNLNYINLQTTHPEYTDPPLMDQNLHVSTCGP